MLEFIEYTNDFIEFAKNFGWLILLPKKKFDKLDQRKNIINYNEETLRRFIKYESKSKQTISVKSILSNRTLKKLNISNDDIKECLDRMKNENLIVYIKTDEFNFSEYLIYPTEKL